MALLETKPVTSVDDVRQFFDAFAHYNVEQHGKADALLQYRISLLKKYAGFKPADEVLDIGCGNGHHLFALDGTFRSAIGIDIAAGMVDRAKRTMPANSSSTFHFLVDDAQTLSIIPDNAVDVVICVGALEHMFDKRSVLSAARRVLRKNGRFICLTLNDQFVWYQKLAPYLGYATRHLATDHRLGKTEAGELMGAAGFRSIQTDYWTFIPQGDMPPFYAKLCRLLDVAGHITLPHHLRGGLVLCGVQS